MNMNLKVKDAIRNMTDEELVYFLTNFDRETLEYDYCKEICPHTKDDSCPIDTSNQCHDENSKKTYKWFIEQKYNDVKDRYISLRQDT